jgi:trehalose 6-phosphate synthase
VTAHDPSDSSDRSPLVLVSNRGPVTFDEDGSFTRGGGGLVTALTGLASHRDAVWIASAMSDGDVAKAQEARGQPFEVRTPEGGEYQVRLVTSDPEAYDGFYNVVANPMLWFIQHYLWDLSNAPDIRENEVAAFEHGYKAVNQDLAGAVIEHIADEQDPIVMVHDYHLYTLPAVVREARPDVFLHHFIHIPWTQPDAWRVLPRRLRDEVYKGVLANDIVGFHTRSYRWNFLQCCRDLLDDVEVDFDRGTVNHDGHETWVRTYPLPIDYEATRAVARSDRTREFEDELERRRREHIILRVDRADLSKNVLRGFTAFDQFLDEHPEFAEKVTFIAQLMPSRMDVPEYQEYLERIEALVAIVNHRHGTPDWMPIQLKLRDDLEEAVAAYKHYDVMIVNAMFDGMNLVAKEGPLVNERSGVSILSENTGAHEELGEFALSVNPFDIKETADSIFTALTMSASERERRLRGLKAAVTARDPGDWIDEQLADIRAKRGSGEPAGGQGDRDPALADGRSTSS